MLGIAPAKKYYCFTGAWVFGVRNLPAAVKAEARQHLMETMDMGMAWIMLSAKILQHGTLDGMQSHRTVGSRCGAGSCGDTIRVGAYRSRQSVG